MPALRSRNRAAVTLVEVLIVMAIIALLAGIALPAIQAARQSARRVQCANNEWQVGRALQNYLSVTKWIPAQTILLVKVLPYMEQQDAVLTCPEVLAAGNVSYAVNLLPPFYQGDLGNKVVLLDGNQATINLTQTSNDWMSIVESRHGDVPNVLHFDGHVDELIVLADDAPPVGLAISNMPATAPTAPAPTVPAPPAGNTTSSGNPTSTNGPTTGGSSSSGSAAGGPCSCCSGCSCGGICQCTAAKRCSPNCKCGATSGVGF